MLDGDRRNYRVIEWSACHDAGRRSRRLIIRSASRGRTLAMAWDRRVIADTAAGGLTNAKKARRGRKGTA